MKNENQIDICSKLNVRFWRSLFLVKAWFHLFYRFKPVFLKLTSCSNIGCNNYIEHYHQICRFCWRWYWNRTSTKQKRSLVCTFYFFGKTLVLLNLNLPLFTSTKEHFVLFILNITQVGCDLLHKTKIQLLLSRFIHSGKSICIRKAIQTI